MYGSRQTVISVSVVPAVIAGVIVGCAQRSKQTPSGGC